MTEQSCILVINCGSSSLKYEVFQFPEKISLGKGMIERIGNKSSLHTHKVVATHKVYEDDTPIKDHFQACQAMAKIITSEEFRLVNSNKNIIAIGHRVVHGGEKYSSSTIIDKSVIRAIEDLSSLAPLHNPANLDGIHSAMKEFPHCKHIAVFDTAFHQTIPSRAYLYGLPYAIYKQYGIRKYGFHGTSHHYVAKKAAEILGKDLRDTNLITCHLGNGSSITAIRKGKSINTSMGFTPLGGVMMGTRSGDIDPAIITFLLEKGMKAKEIDIMLNKKSGLLGISGISNDMRDIEEAASHDNRAVLALEMFAHHVRKFIGAYVAELAQVDILVFTAGIGQFGEEMRQRICTPFKGLGIQLDIKRNKEVGKTDGIISFDESPVKIAVIPTNEELQIALDAYTLSQS